MQQYEYEELDKQIELFEMSDISKIAEIKEMSLIDKILAQDEVKASRKGKRRDGAARRKVNQYKLIETEIYYYELTEKEYTELRIFGAPLKNVSDYRIESEMAKLGIDMDEQAGMNSGANIRQLAEEYMDEIYEERGKETIIANTRENQIAVILKEKPEIISSIIKEEYEKRKPLHEWNMTMQEWEEVIRYGKLVRDMDRQYMKEIWPVEYRNEIGDDVLENKRKLRGYLEDSIAILKETNGLYEDTVRGKTKYKAFAHRRKIEAALAKGLDVKEEVVKEYKGLGTVKVSRRNKIKYRESEEVER